MGTKKRIAILGASGYTGAELIRLLQGHPHVEISVLTGDSQAGKPMGQVYPHLSFTNLPKLIALKEVDYSTIDLVFCCLPHGTTQEVIAAIPASVKVIDLSADFRLSNIETYATWYGHPHRAAQLQKTAVYGLTEINRDAIRNARLVANPGCYPTSAQLPLIPLLKNKLIDSDTIVIDSKSGVTGAGRAAKQGILYSEVTDGFAAYGVGSHRHAPEIEQGLAQAAGHEVVVSFTPHLVPMNRGILSTLYVRLQAGATQQQVTDCLHTAYDSEPFVHIAPTGMVPSTHMVRGTNHSMIGVFADRKERRLILVSVIDNLVKGASGQAIQNMNLMYGWPETTSLNQTAVFP